MKTTLAILAAFSAFSISVASAAVTVTNDTGTTTVVDNGSRTSTYSGWNLNGGNTAFVWFSAEGEDLSTATFGGESMTIVQATSAQTDGTNRWNAGLAYLINPATSSGDIVLNWVDSDLDLSPSQNEAAYTPLALGGVGGVAASGATDTGNLSFDYTTTLDGGYVLGNAVNNSFNFGSPPTVSGDHLDSNDSSDYEFYSNVSGNFSTIHAHDSVPTAGSYNETFSNSNAASAIAFEAVVIPEPSTALLGGLGLLALLRRRRNG